MSQPKTHRVTPRSNGKWQFKTDGNARATAVTDTQREAIEAAKRVAHNQGGELIVHGKDGRIVSKDSINSNDPNPPKDKEH